MEEEKKKEEQGGDAVRQTASSKNREGAEYSCWPASRLRENTRHPHG